MREPDFEIDGWALDNGEERHRDAPKTFWTPSLQNRQKLQVGDYAKLIFRISVTSNDEPESFERMWVLVRERVGNDYLGVLTNNPQTIDENEILWNGTELPFSPCHIIDIQVRDEDSIKAAKGLPSRSWR